VVTEFIIVEDCPIPEGRQAGVYPGEIDLATPSSSPTPSSRWARRWPSAAAGSASRRTGSDRPVGRHPLAADVQHSGGILLGAIAALFAVFIATTIGSVAAFYGGWLDAVLMRFADLVLLVPLIPILIVVKRAFNLNLPLGSPARRAVRFGGTAIVLKSQALGDGKAVRRRRSRGRREQRHIIFRHIIPNVLPLSFLYMMFTVTDAISLEATLSFLGLMNTPMSWGIMIYTTHSQGYLLSGTSYWWLLIPAGMAVTLVAASFFLVGRAMDEVINPRLRRR
jgi:peptide/nickel transport system permease protein